MPYLVHWSIFILDDVDPLTAAERAREMQADPNHAVYGLHETETGRLSVVDLRIPQVIELDENYYES